MFAPDRSLSDGKVTALKLLKAAFDDAEDSDRDRWQSAIRKAALLTAGVSVSGLRWLIVSHLAEAAQEITTADDRERKFRDTPPLALLDGDCFVLTHGGKIYVDNHLTSANGASQRDKSPITPRRASRRGDQNGRQARGAPDPTGDALPSDAPRPEWHPIHGELYFRGRLVRRRGRKLGSQEEFLLGLFHDAKWDHSLSISLPTEPIETFSQLRECVRRLNDHMLLDTLQFHAYVSPNGPIASWEESAPRCR